MTVHGKVTFALRHAARFRWLAPAGWLFLAGCGGQANRNPAPDADPTDSGIEGSKTLDELEIDEIETLCEGLVGDFQEQLNSDVGRGFCILALGADAASAADCQEQVDSQCNLEPDPVDSDPSECIDDLRSVDECKVTVEQLERCLDAQLEYLEWVSNLTCESFLELEDPQASLDSLPAPCQVLTESCPALFEGPVEGGGAAEPPAAMAGGGPSVSGSIDGQPVQSALGSVSVSLPGSSQQYSVGAADSAELRLTGDGDFGQGLLRLPAGGPTSSAFICLDEVTLVHGPSGVLAGFTATSLSVIESCDSQGGLPVALSFTVGGAVQGEFRGEPVPWLSNGFSCGGDCTLGFITDTGTVELALRGLNGISDGSDNPFAASTLYEVGERTSVACGGPGTFTQSSGESTTISIDIDEFGPSLSCPGEPVAGELSGTLAVF